MLKIDFRDAKKIYIDSIGKSGKMKINMQNYLNSVENGGSSVKKLKCQLVLPLLVMLLLAGCEARMSIEIFLNNGEGVEASLDIVDHSRIKVDDESGRIYVVRGDVVLLEGRFFTQGEFSSYIEEIGAKYSVNILKAVPEESPSYYSFEATVDNQVQYGFLEKIVGSDQTSVLLLSRDLSYEEAGELFGQLHFDRIK